MPTTSQPNPLFVGIDLVPSKGGPFKSVGYFQRALGGRALSFTHPDDRAEASAVRPPVSETSSSVPTRSSLPATRYFHPPSSSPYTHIWSVGGRLGRMFLYAKPGEIARADACLPGADLLSCHILYRHSAHWVASRARREGVPYWIVPHGCLDPYVFTYRAGIKKAWMRLFGRRILRDARHVIFSTRRELEKAACWLPEGHANARVVPWPVEPPDMAGAAEARARLRARHGVGDGETVFLYLGRLHEMKRPRETLAAFAHARLAGARLWIAGPDGEVTAKTLEAEARALGVAERVSCLGGVFGAEKTALLAGADAYVSLSARENFNHAAAESLAAGLPVILSPGNDLGPELDGVEAADLLSTDALDEAAEAFRRMAERSPGERRARGARGRAWAERELSFERFAQNLRALHAEAVAGK
jgi:glycosyltransferase involved in cell wall biosynthesis